jgi:crotonobetainyl-CoA:carnitine CoA-transferase CaiB-like acyl-CoA transferase
MPFTGISSSAGAMKIGKSPLEGYLALDLTDEKGFLCGRILGDLGVDVIKVEPPGGDPSRRIAPFYKDIPDPEKSLYWFAYNANKRGITLNIESEEGKEIFKKLVKTAHFVIESHSPGYMDSLGLGYPSLSRVNRAIILTSITPFGQAGPYASYKASDITEMGMCGLMYLCGDPDLPPARISFPQAYLHGYF